MPKAGKRNNAALSGFSERPLVTIAIILLSIATAYYVGAVVFLWSGLRRLKPSGTPQNLTYSVVIAARNEEKVIGRCLESVLSQSLPKERYEVMVVNDRSEDRTGDICEEYCRRFPALSHVVIRETPPGVAPKKHAVASGIARARHEVVVLTDADCVVPSGWLAAIDRNFTEKTDLVQGISAYGYSGGMGRFFFNLQAVDFLSHGVVAAAAMGAGMPLNSNANNFAFRKKAYDEARGYGGVSGRVVSGDDDLLLQRIARQRKGNTSFMIDQAGAVVTRPAPTLRAVFEQRKRWGSKTVNYAPPQAVFLAGIFLYYCGIASALAAGFFDHVFVAVFLAMFASKLTGEWLLMFPGAALLHQKKLRPYILPASILQLPLVLAAVVFGVFGRFSWKGERFARAVK
ncbi:MAG: glycosyltransferase [Chitinispirillaceae bacterium]|nr:glycosyltransferase [Chitinispirillaceae bacterium]